MVSETLILSLGLCSVPLTYFIGSMVMQVARHGGCRWQFGFAVSSFFGALVAIITQLYWPEAKPASWLSSTPVSFVLLGLITFIAVIITRFSHHYMAGEARESDYYQHLYLTLAVVSLAVISNHLLLFLGAWIAISLSLHQLLLFYPERPRAALAAHKKFIFARVAELSLFGSAMMLYAEHGTWRIDEILVTFPKDLLSGYEHIAALLLAFTALVKCAQLPIHGWLIQVVEAPTPVSALLHAGIVNLGGYLLILFAPLLSHSAPAQWLLLIVAGLTTLLAGLIMLTRVSIKVRLAWSTSAQMGLMLVECALGLYELALLHLVAHSCYKAFAFLNSGSAAETQIYREMATVQRTGLDGWLMAFVVALLLVAVPVYWLAPSGPYSPWLLLAVMLTVLLAENREHYAQVLASTLGLGLVLIVVYCLQKTGFVSLVTPMASSVGIAGDLWFGFLILLLVTGYIGLRNAASTNASRRLWNALYAGLYLDEWATRVTLAIWPTSLPKRMNPKQLASSQLKPELSL